MKKVETIKVADIARALGLRPQTARARLRRKYEDDDGSMPQPLYPWAFQPKDKRAIVKLISTP